MENALFTEEEAMNYDGGGWLSLLGAGLLVGGVVTLGLAMTVFAPPLTAVVSSVYGAAAAVSGAEAGCLIASGVGIIGGLGCLFADNC